MFMLLQQLMQNPMSLIAQKFNVPQGMNNPQEIVQHLLKTGQITQQQVDNATQIRNNNPMFKGML
jgi:hypothetical protein